MHLTTSVKLGMVIEPETVLFWLRQTQEAREKIMFSLTDVRVALQDFSNFIDEHSNRETVRVWGNSSSFDNTILSNAYKMADIERPWRWIHDRCFRTVRNIYSQVEYNPERDKKGTAHSAVDDAVFQAQHLMKIKQRNKK